MLAVAALAGLAAQISCGGGSTTAYITAITISPTSQSLGINEQLDFTATVTLSNNTTLTTTSTGSTTVTTTNTSVSWQVNGVAGGNGTVGTIVNSPTDNQVGEYTAPGVVPSTNNGQVTITATANQTQTTSTTSTTITSNAATITITVQLGINVTPVTAPVSAGGAFQFTALQNNLPDNNAIWTISSTNGGNIGTIDSTGLYTAPLYPPPGAVVTITATDGANSSSATATINYSDMSLYGPFAFSYAGGSGSQYMAVAGSFETDGQGNILGGVEDVTSPLTGTAEEIPIYNGTYVVAPDGRTNVNINTARGTNIQWQFALTTNQHGLLINFNREQTGSGTIDQQNLNDLTASDSVLATCGVAQCPYVFGVSGLDASSNPQGLAGYFTTTSAGSIPQSGTALDVNDNGAVATTYSDLNGSFSFDTTFNGSGRGVMTLTSAATNHQYAFYVIDSTHLKLVEIDSSGFLAGDVYSAPLGNSFTVAELPAQNFAFTSAGSSSLGGYAVGGVFTSDGNGNVTAGVLDVNNAGSITADTTLGSCPYTVNSSNGRIDLKIFAASGTCSGAGSTLSEFAAYPSSAGPVLALEIDANAISSGVVYPQSVLATAAPIQPPVTGSFAMSFAGEGVSKVANTATPQDMEGQAYFNSTIAGTEYVDINDYTSIFKADPFDTSTSSISAPSSPLYRGTATIALSNPEASYSFVYYVVDNNTALVLDQDTLRVGTGIVARQF